ncbi:MAG: ABC transporter permease, partial [Hydrogenoanaerobacterium sp.]
MEKLKRLASKGKQNFIVLLALLVLVIIFSLLNKNFVDKYNIVSMAQSLAPYAILALGVTFVIATGGIDLSIGTVCIASAVVAGKMFMDGMPLALTIPVMILIGTFFGLINGILVAKLKIPAFIATLGTMMFSRGLSAI